MKEQSYSLLIVSSSDSINQALLDVFCEPLFSPLNIVTNISAAKRAIKEREFDIVIINAPLSDDTGYKFALDLVESSSSVIMYMAKSELYLYTYDLLVSHGIFTTQKPVSKLFFQSASSWLISARERMRKTEKKELSFEEKMKEIKIINHAKWILITELKMTESEAHRYIEKQAMDRCVSKSNISEEIIKTYT